MWYLYVLNYFANRKGFIHIEDTCQWVKIYNAYSTIIMDVHCSTWSFLQDFFFQSLFDISLTNVYLIEKLIKPTWTTFNPCAAVTIRTHYSLILNLNYRLIIKKNTLYFITFIDFCIYHLII